ncbi:hypothetical protein MCOR27_008525 [Pyricularia oryzae]|uniref:Noc2-domain-containing protein n=4 Tax=Pyricularia TaxID=48558 RepID=A0ABQ8NDT4_PYRGI|nr:nucleolar complex protein 2 [Pyricularia oryzae 70-15]ELQ42117.1 nucleolar complex protein 2 [Pyricularia oryzae Y34]KAH8837190.1 hypothetical protein MCOR01_010828 [Pyricularia oryzae]KAI6295410.1 hypothetical protein MCOR33_007686 [Pyricularia grisea]EHA54086.1 nucleolar complex protein 2 [Pyricularia oryzae 70-15]KAI6272061.1 hypothetical protein MCOR27_008525 [Pyricularia oryzae]
MASSKKNLKATKKFEKKHLKGVIEKRKAAAKIKQRTQVQAKKQLKKKADDAFYKGDNEGGEGAAVSRAKPKPGAKVSEMSVDDFFKGGFEILDGKQGKGRKGKLGKRKRDDSSAAKENGEQDSDSDESVADAPVESDSSDDDNDDLEEDVGMTKEAMDALAEKDPEFYKFLKENDPEALDFDENADMAEIDALSSGDEEVQEKEDDEQPKKKRKTKKQDDDDESGDETSSGTELTREQVARWKKLLTETHSLRAARQVVLAFRSAAHLDADQDGRQPRYSITSPEVFHDVMVLALKQIPEVLQHHVPVKESAAHKTYVQTEGKKFKTLSILVKNYTASILHVLRTLSDDGTLKMTISALTPLLPYLLSFRKLLKTLIKTVVNFWAQNGSSESTRITAFLVLRRLVVIGDKGVREALLKAVYHGLVQGSRATNHNTIQAINLMKNSAAGLWGVDQSIGYTTAFSFIRQLAIHLRNSIVHNQNDAYRAVYNWQYVHSLDFWSCVLSEHCSSLAEAEAGRESQLKLLVYPLVQVTLGAMRLIPTATYFPLRFLLIRSLLRLSRATGTYIPLASPLLEVLQSAEMRKPPKASTLTQLDFSVNYKAPKSHLRTRVYQDGVGDQVVELMAEYFALWSTNIAFPEFALPVLVNLKRWVKDSRKRGSGNNNNKVVSAVVLLVQKLEANAKFIEERRSKIDFAPRDRSQVAAFLKDFDWEKTPVGAFVVSQRKIRAERARQLEDARREEDKKRKEEEEEAKKAELDDQEDDDQDEDGEEDVEDDEDSDEDVDDDDDEDEDLVDDEEDQ